MSNFEFIGCIIRFHRRKARLTQKQLATLAGVGKTAVFDVEKGKNTVRLNTLTAILSVLNIQLIPQSPLMDQYNCGEGHE